MPSVTEPETLAEAAEALREAAGAGRSVSIERDGGDVRLSTRRLARVLEHEPGDLTAVVEAGIRLSELNAALAEHGQMLALDAPGDPTIGACVAGALSGPRRHRYGGPRDLVLGVTVVLSDGTVASSGGKVVKNVAGYDLGKLFCGSRGRLGLVARVGLRLHPLPASTRTVVAPLSDLQAVLRSQLVPSAFDLLLPGRLALLFEGGERSVAAQVTAACDLLGGAEDASVWAEVAERQLAAGGRAVVRDPAALEDAIVRAGSGEAYLPAGAPVEQPPALVALHERLRAAFDPEGVLAA